MSEIIQDGHPTLRNTAHPVPIDAIASQQFRTLIADMHDTLSTVEDGVALAAPQINAPWRIFVVSPRAFDPYVDQPLTYINPTITSTSKKKESMEEGCLSVRWKYGNTKRHAQTTVHAHDEHGCEFVRGGSGLLAQIFQHEIDHLDGILFHDHATGVHETEPPSIS
ncbi:MAG: peptide deformylase [Planctomycetota bacterium]|jgi:peptide deformylase